MDCMKNYIKVSSTVTHTVEENYRIWYNKNKYRKLTLIKQPRYKPFTAPEYWGEGLTHDKWVAMKQKEAAEKRKATGSLAAVAGEQGAAEGVGAKKK